MAGVAVNGKRLRARRFHASPWIAGPSSLRTAAMRKLPALHAPADGQGAACVMPAHRREPCWTLSDGTRVELGGRVIGTGETARKARALLGSPPVFVVVAAQPDGSVELDAKNPYLLDAFVRGVARWLGLTFETDYAPKLEDAPRDVQELVRALQAEPFDPRKIY